MNTNLRWAWEAEALVSGDIGYVEATAAIKCQIVDEITKIEIHVLYYQALRSHYVCFD